MNLESCGHIFFDLSMHDCVDGEQVYIVKKGLSSQ